MAEAFITSSSFEIDGPYLFDYSVNANYTGSRINQELKLLNIFSFLTQLVFLDMRIVKSKEFLRQSAPILTMLLTAIPY